jgi:hypothetical protein
VNRLTMLVTPDGRWVLEDSAEFLAALGDPEPDYDAATFAVKNLGFVKFQILDDSLIEIELHPCNIELPALLAVQQQLLSSQVRLFRIKYFDRAWHSEITSSKEGAVSRLSELCAPMFAPAPTERFVVEPKDFARLCSDEPNQLRPLAQKWRVSFAHFDPSITALALRHDLLSRLIIIGIMPNGRAPRFRFIGDGHRWMGTYLLNGVGENVENQPDKEYGEWVGETYKSVAASGQPRYDLVSAMLQFENETGKPRRMTRYERLLLPWKTPSEEVFVTMCSKPVDMSGVSEFPYSGPDSLASRNAANSW